jgi:hypothetical protein
MDLIRSEKWVEAVMKLCWGMISIFLNQKFCRPGICNYKRYSLHK